ncbi:metal-dependent transcriptional regulator [Paucilactobacillus sp. N302-9]|jgi:DtxR family Mn-dependent transcriptional regulator
MTPMKEDYLKIIFELGGVQRKVANKEIALSLGVAAGSVTEMVTKLVEEKLVVHEPYAGISLTDAGLQVATQLVRKHRLWEDFLVNKLKYDLPDVHPEAEVLEHQTSERLINALDDFLQHPKYCPHGGVIPDKNGHFEDISHLSLAQGEDGQHVIIERFIDNHELLTYLHEIGLNVNDKVKIIEHVPFEGPIQIIRQDDHQQLNVSYKAAHNIFIRSDKS